jgi:hypothetical protein
MRLTSVKLIRSWLSWRRPIQAEKSWLLLMLFAPIGR